MRAYICGYFTHLDMFKRLSDAAVGRLYRAMLLYGRDGVEPSLPEDSPEAVIWDSIKVQLDLDQKRYDRKCENFAKGREALQNKRNGKTETPAPAAEKPKGKDEIADLKRFIASMSS